MAPLVFEFPISVRINGGMVSRRSTKSQTSITSQTVSAKGKKSVRKGDAFLSRIVLIAWLLIGAIGVAAIGTMYASVDLDVKAPHPARYLRMVPDEGFAGYANATLAFWDFASDKVPVQVIQTRFMQFQPHLLALGEARLKIFATFCLPSILAQSSKKFLWLIRADPDLDPALKDPLIAMIQQYPNILLVGSNQNPEGFRHRASVVDITPSNVWSGSYELLRRFHNEAQSRMLIETRLDADDGLHFAFVEYTQLVATEELSSADHEWVIFCASAHLEWHHTSPFKQKLKGSDVGFMVGVNEMGCITPGLSFVYGTNVTRSDMPIGAHSFLHRKAPLCDDKRKSKCIRHTKELKPAAIRARTPTSAGMKNVVIGSHDQSVAYRTAETDANIQEEMWIGVGLSFGVKKERVRDLRRSLTQHLPEIVADNLRGQCTKGHSCKDNTKQALEELLKRSARK